MSSSIPSPDPHRALRAHLSAADPDLAALVARVGPCGLRVEADRAPYEALVNAIAYQQLHGRAAQAILGRLVALAGGVFPAPEALLALSEADLRACGLSGSKIRAIRGVAQARRDGIVPSRRQAESMDDDELIARLTSLRGVGRWTVEMLLIFSLGRPDVMPVDDFGVREGWRAIKRLDAQPRPAALAAIARDWSPYRSAAAWYLWRAAEAAKAGRYVSTGP
ncbi:DNA-3-methyladenine glycosylase family protein [Gluconacetobacter sacchari]|uniref:DNA-3-methyladenine glycosylase II n=2 Tax=Gluconacetobacter sacchari TaxID=92759 RepID=A0A7W4I9P5_9PROT|nr:DNA-3-methyladenine glycosylase [Gluconacetobacter sacchari]MBB2158858.1 DNA-3-methyladenine glycosylase 2 family protein [Gluconacetobacter sacchari]GBQ21258.1 DNA-3-methyladenine glycosylase [Gluconacetobacter sacchari DSM 12717]